MFLKICDTNMQNLLCKRKAEEEKKMVMMLMKTFCRRKRDEKEKPQHMQEQSIGVSPILSSIITRRK